MCGAPAASHTFFTRDEPRESTFFAACVSCGRCWQGENCLDLLQLVWARRMERWSQVVVVASHKNMPGVLLTSVAHFLIGLV